MTVNTTLPDNEEALASLYNETIEQHNSYLEKIHSAFDNRCEEIGEQTKEKLSKIGESDQEAKAAILQEEQELLNKTLAELKYAINRSNSNARKTLEKIETKMDTKGANLDDELANL
jgi:hypothetical protein